METPAYTLVHPDGTVERTSLEAILSRSERTVLYFYPADNTPGCTLEAQSFTRLKSDFEALGIQVIGTSLDSADSHREFHQSCGLGIDLISDPDKTLHNPFGVIGEKQNYGKTYIGVIRSTFLLDRSGKILKEWRNVRATGHAERVLREVLKSPIFD